MRCAKALLLLAALLALIVLITFAAPLRADVSGLPFAEQVLLPRFAAAFNEWCAGHPTAPDHYSKLDKKDLARWEAARDAFHRLEREMKNAGY